MNANDPAFPQHGWTSDPKTLERMAARQGLTIREHMAARAMQGLLASMPDAENAEREERPIEALSAAARRIALASAAYADALIAELNKPNCSCGEPHISDRIEHCYDGKPCFVKP